MYFLNRGTIGLVDVGSAGGLPSHFDTHINQLKAVLSFEPREGYNLAFKRIFHESVVLWNKREMRNFYIYKGLNQTGSSLFIQNTDYVKKNFNKLRKIGNRNLANTWFSRSELVKKYIVRCDTLDAVLARYPKGMFNFLKIDAQGAEYQILQGAKGFLKNDCCAVFLETFRLPLYKGIYLYPDIKALLLNHGFILVKKYPPHGSFNSQNDCLFLNKRADADKLAIIRRVYGITD